jgi:hypothetical protein
MIVVESNHSQRRYPVTSVLNQKYEKGNANLDIVYNTLFGIVGILIQAINQTVNRMSLPREKRVDSDD